MLFKSISFPNLDASLLTSESLIDIFLKTVQGNSEKTACVFGDSTCTYQELDSKSSGVAQKLFDLNIGPGDILGVFLPRGIELHVAILGILKAGAAYIPFDIETPKERIESVLLDFNLTFCVTHEILNEKLQTISLTDADVRSNSAINYAQADSLAYIIFTSGSTGKPKGIPIKHNQIAHLLKSENSQIQIQASDVIYQGFSVSFDMWFEETWLGYLAGATLIIADAKISKSVDILHEFLNKHQVTILHAVPSLLAMLDVHIPSLRLVNSGGEACNKNILDKWASRDLIFLNSYGPTETTVTSSLIQLKVGDEISIGKPLPNYSMGIVNEAMELVDVGQEGELVISGPCVSEGYFQRPDLSEKVFLNKPNSLSEMFGDRIYLSGDIGKMNSEGNFFVTSRKDDQIKWRGYRIELGEIEAHFNAIDVVQQAVVVLKRVQSLDHLVAYVILKKECLWEEKVLRNELNKELPNYMIPSLFIQVNAFQHLASGKVDKKKLPEPEINPSNTIASNVGRDQSIIGILTELFPGSSIDLKDDFFTDLGGYSMLAAQFVSEVRNLEGMEQISIMDVYEHRPLKNLVAFWESKKASKNQYEAFQKTNTLTYFACWAAQSASLFFIFGLVAAQIFLPFLGYYFAIEQMESHLFPLLIAVFIYCTVVPISGISIWMIKKLFIGKFTAGDYPLWGLVFFKWWLQRRLVALLPKELFSNTPFYGHLLRLFGVQVSSDTQLSNFEIGVEDLVSIGKNVTISSNVVLNNAWVENGQLKLRHIEIEDHAYVGTSSIISGGCHLAERGEVRDLSLLPFGQNIDKNEIWGGSPAQNIGLRPQEETVQFVSKKKKIAFQTIFLVLIFAFPVLVLLPLAPSIISLYYLDNEAEWYSFYYLFKTPIFSFIYILLFIFELVFLTRIFQKNILPGRYSIYSKTYVIKWFLDALFSLSLNVIKPIFATVFISWIYKALGAKVGKNTEISTASNVTHSLFEIGDESFIADDVVIGESEVRNQMLYLNKTTIGNRSFIGNSALIPQGYSLGDGMLIGVISVPPTADQLKDQPYVDWFGSPAKGLPNREKRDIYPPELTYRPHWTRKFSRGIVEFIRVLIPQSIILSVSILFIAYTDDLIKEQKWHEVFLYFPFYYLGLVALPIFLFNLMLKWVMVGRYQKAEYPMWTWQVWRTEAITSMYESLTVPFLFEYIKGTPFLPIFFRLMGVKIGKRVYMDSTDITEFDLVSVGDYCAINLDSGPQTHLFEDRVMKMGAVHIGAYSNIGARTVILYDTEIEENCSISALSLVMKGEKLPSKTFWTGIPIKN
jgi:acyl-coenzyme A synthetase/AMP-(fatty) acid ligase/acetyltransferase-like isoleucine patch superfamily enzyme